MIARWAGLIASRPGRHYRPLEYALRERACAKDFLQLGGDSQVRDALRVACQPISTVVIRDAVGDALEPQHFAHLAAKGGNVPLVQNDVDHGTVFAVRQWIFQPLDTVAPAPAHRLRAPRRNKRRRVAITECRLR